MNEKFLNYALLEAKKAGKKKEIPVGCVVVKNNKIISKGYNYREKSNNVLMHAEIVAISKACKKIKSWRLDDCVIYVTLEPCMMCLGAILECRLKKVYFGTKNNSEQMYDKNKISKYIEMINLNNIESAQILTDFFKNKRKK